MFVFHFSDEDERRGEIIIPPRLLVKEGKEAQALAVLWPLWPQQLAPALQHSAPSAQHLLSLAEHAAASAQHFAPSLQHASALQHAAVSVQHFASAAQQAAAFVILQCLAASFESSVEV
jgi:hypothetical protein